MPTRDVPLLVLEDNRVEFDYGPSLDFSSRRPLDALSLLASTQTGFLPRRSPDYRFPGPLADISQLCDAAGYVYVREDERRFRSWMQAEADALVARLERPDQLADLALRLPLPQQELLMVPLIYLNHMWRQGSPTLEPASGPSAMHPTLDALLYRLGDSTGILPRFNQILMTMRAWRVDDLPPGAPASYRDVTDLSRVVPYFWFLRDTPAELTLYRGFFVLESLGSPLPGWACLALECAAEDDVELGRLALRHVYATLRNVYFGLRHLLPQIDAAGFRKVQLTGGWVDDELTGVASGYQLPCMLMLDALFGVEFTHPGTIESRKNNLRYAPELWLDFFRSIREASPSFASWVRERRCQELTDDYQRCVELFTLFRSMHRHIAGPILRGETTTGRTFDSRDHNYRQFMSEMGGLVADTAATGVPAKSTIGG